MRSFAKVLTVVAPALVLSTLPVHAAGPFQYHPINPCRVADTRTGNGGTMTASADRSFQVQGVCGVPSGAKAVSLNVTVVATGGGGYLTLYPSNVARPTNVSTINFVRGDVVANGAIVPLGPAGAPPNADLRVFAGTGGNVEVILDVSGYFQ
jgi:hypothetical protein